MKFLYVFFLLVFFVGCKQSQNKFVSPGAAADYQTTTKNSTLVHYLQQLDSARSNITVVLHDSIVQGYKMPLVIVDDAIGERSEKLALMIMAQQHGNEPSGKEGVLNLLTAIANGKYSKALESVRLVILPQVNPRGGDSNMRRNANDMDINRDHLLLATSEAQLVHQIFQQYKPHVVVDVHEYYPYRNSWETFGYLKDFDIQLGGLTNPLIDSSLRTLFYDEIIPFVKNDVEAAGYSFFEYTLGQIHSEPRKLRYSTVHIDDGRQSFGIMNSLGLIIEGKNGKTETHNLKRRVLSQQSTMGSLINYFARNKAKVILVVNEAQAKLTDCDAYSKVGVRFSHKQSGEKLHYPLRSIATGKDTVFVVSEYFDSTVVDYAVKPPKSYLVPVSDSMLVQWLVKHDVSYRPFVCNKNDRLYQYRIHESEMVENSEGWLYRQVKVQKEQFFYQKDSLTFYEVPVCQPAGYKVVLAFEPESMLAIHNNKAYEYLIDRSHYKIVGLR
ncbi:MAG: M14 family zinc carboxypeptidase [Salinivirgaceae bacterium]|nr:M14 family zinc carboxypeptidase [Salinivirgaceae bacterium]